MHILNRPYTRVICEEICTPQPTTRVSILQVETRTTTNLLRACACVLWPWRGSSCSLKMKSIAAQSNSMKSLAIIAYFAGLVAVKASISIGKLSKTSFWLLFLLPWRVDGFCPAYIYVHKSSFFSTLQLRMKSLSPISSQRSPMNMVP